MSSLRTALQHATPDRLVDALVDAGYVDPTDDGRAAAVIRPLIEDVWAALMPMTDEELARHARGRERLRRAIVAQARPYPGWDVRRPASRRDIVATTSTILAVVGLVWILILAAIDDSTPRPGPQPTTSQPGASVTIGSQELQATAQVPAGTSPASLDRAPSPSEPIPTLPATDVGRLFRKVPGS